MSDLHEALIVVNNFPSAGVARGRDSGVGGRHGPPLQNSSQLRRLVCDRPGEKCAGS